MNQNNNSKTSIFLLMYFIILLLTLPVTVLVTLISQCIKQRSRIKHSKEIRKLSLGNISHPIEINEAFELEEDKSHYYVPYPKRNEKYIKFDWSRFFGFECEKEYFFFDGKLYKCNIQLSKKCDSFYPKFIFYKLKKANGYPDEVRFDKKLLKLECTWYGINGVIHFIRYACNMVEMTFELNKRAGE